MNLQTFLLACLTSVPLSLYAEEPVSDCPGVTPLQLRKANAIPDVLAYNPVQSPSQHEPLVQMSTKAIDPNNPQWSPFHPKWKAIENRIRADLTRDLDTTAEVLAKEMHPIAACAYAQMLSDKELDDLKQYAESAAGKRHVQFGAELGEIMVKMFTETMSRASQKTSGPPLHKASPEIVQARLNLIQDSLSIGLMQNMASAIKRKNGDVSGYAAFGYIYADLVSLVGEPLDGLGVKYKDDLKVFQDFVHSPLMSKYGEAWAKVTVMPAFEAAVRRYSNGVVESSVKAGAEWKQRYQESVVMDPEIQASQR